MDVVIVDGRLAKLLKEKKQTFGFCFFSAAQRKIN
jgi:hypothetical protein